MRGIIAVLFVVTSACTLDLDGGDDSVGDDDVVLIPDGRPGDCTADLRPGVFIVVVAEDGAPIGDATVTVRDSVWWEVLQGDPFSGTYSGAWERPGVYNITVERPGFVTVQLGSIEVTADECHVITEALTITMIASPR